MNWLLILYNTWVGITGLTSFASLAPMAFLIKFAINKQTATRDRRLLLFFAFFCFSVAYEAGNAAITMGTMPTPGRIIPWLIALRMSGRVLECAGAVLLTMRMAGLINGYEKERKES